jgi:protein disulfide-isomerase A6
VTVVAVDATVVQALASKYKVEGFPTIKVFGENKGAPTDYQGAREGPAIVQFAMKEVAALVQARSGGGGGKKGGKGSSGGSGGGGGGGAHKPASETGGGKSVVTLTSENFDELVLNGPEAWLVEFYAPWCGHCKNLAPEWASAADKMKGDGAVKFGAVDATAHAALAQRFDVKGYPTIKQFSGGAGKKDSDAKDYTGERKSGALVEAATQLAASGGAPAAPIKVEQLVSRAQWAEGCAGKTLCVLAVLPHILDDKKAGRDARLATLGEAAAKSRGKPFKFLWTEAGAQPKLESALAVGLVPALFAVSTEKKIFIAHKGSFAAAAVTSFAAGLTTNKGAAGAQPLPPSFDAGAAVTDVAAWDGKDAKQEGGGDSFSLDELDL